MALAEHTVDLVEVTVGERALVEGFVLHDKRIEGLRVLAPADITDETRTIEHEALAAEGRGGLARGVGEEDLVDLARLGIGDDGATGGGGIESGLAVFVAIGGRDILALDHRFQSLPRRRGVADLRAQGNRVGRPEVRLLHAFVAQAGRSPRPSPFPAHLRANRRQTAGRLRR